MGKILDTPLPQAPREYNIGIFNQLISKLQLVLGIKIHTSDDADETEAINFFLSN